MRLFGKLLGGGGILTAALFVNANCFGQQPPQGQSGDQGGGGRMRGGGGTADDSFGRLQQSYGGSGDSIDMARITPESRARVDRFAQMTGSPPLPTSGTVSRDQYRESFTRQMEAMTKARSANGGGMMMQGGPQGGTTMTTGGGGRGGFGGPGGGGNGGGGASFGTEEWTQQRFKESDKNGDGKISFEEASDRTKPSFKQIDTNGDGFIDYAEYKVYIGQRMSGAPSMPAPPGSDPSQANMSFQQQPQWGGNNGFDPNARNRAPESAEPERPVVYRYGKLPKELPAWFTKLDEDKDGQVGLYEWRKDSREVSLFTDMDLNGDGFITAEEYIRYRAGKDEDEKKASGGASTADVMRGGTRGAEKSSGNGGNSGGNWGGTKGGKGEKSDKSESKKNPFRG